MNAIDVLFNTDRFNLSKRKEHYINDCCFGDDLAAWLRQELGARGVQAIEPGQEDWGWYLETQVQGGSYSLNIGGNSDEEAGNPDKGEWRIMVLKHRSFKDKLTGKGLIDPGDPLLGQVLEICRAQPDFSEVRTEAG